MRTLPQWYRDEREKLRGYGPRERLKYVWQYYKLWIIGIGFILGFTAYALTIYFTTPGDIHFYGILSNTYAPLGPGSAFYSGFVEAAGFDLKTGVVELDCQNYCKPSERVTGNTYYEKLVSMLDSGTDDIWVSGVEEIRTVGAAGRLMDLSRVDAVREKYADRFVYCQPLRDDYSSDPVPVGVDLSGTALTGPYSPYPEGAALAINAYTKRPDAAIRFLDYVFEYAGQ